MGEPPTRRACSRQLHGFGERRDVPKGRELPHRPRPSVALVMMMSLVEPAHCCAVPGRRPSRTPIRPRFTYKMPRLSWGPGRLVPEPVSSAAVIQLIGWRPRKREPSTSFAHDYKCREPKNSIRKECTGTGNVYSLTTAYTRAGGGVVLANPVIRMESVIVLDERRKQAAILTDARKGPEDITSVPHNS